MPTLPVLHRKVDDNFQRVIPSSGAIHTKSNQEGRTFYYSSLNIEWSKDVKWKVHIGDVVAISSQPVPSTKKERQQYLQELKKWKPNHYEKSSPHWKIGLVVALQKQITKNIQGRFDCHVQWFDKALDLPQEDFKKSKLKESFRSYSRRQAKKGSQLPHILINRPGDYGVVSPFQILPVTITMMHRQDFMNTGVLDGQETPFSLICCCLKTRRPMNEQQSDIQVDRSILNEHLPDAWTNLNPPVAGSSNGSSISSPTVPEPLEKAWTGWISTVYKTISSDANSLQCYQVPLAESLRRGWNETRRERYRRAVLDSQIEPSTKNSNTDMQSRSEIGVQQRQTASKTRRWNSSKTQLERSSIMKDKTASQLNRSTAAANCGSSKKRKGHELAQSFPKRKKEIRFSADTKDPSADRGLPGGDSDTKLSMQASLHNITKQARVGRQEERTMVDSIHPESKALSKKQPIRKRGLSHDTDEPLINRLDAVDESGSTSTRDTHSTDTTVQARGAGRKFFSKRKSNTNNECDAHDEISTVTTTSSTNSSNGLSSVSDVLEEWEVDTTCMTAIHRAGNKVYYPFLRMQTSEVDTLFSIYNEAEIAALGFDRRKDPTFDLRIGSVVAVHCEDGIAENTSWSPFRVRWGVAQITSIYTSAINRKEREREWFVNLKWFYRFSELKKTSQKLVHDTMNTEDGLVETTECCESSVMSILPVHVQITSNEKEFSSTPRIEQGKYGFPCIRMLCQHLLSSKNKVNIISDWKYDFLEFREKQHSLQSWELEPPLKRAVDKATKGVRALYFKWLSLQNLSKVEGNDLSDRIKGLHREDNSLVDNSVITSESSSFVYEEWGVKFFDSVHLNVKNDVLCGQFQPTSDDWMLAVGHIAPVYCTENASVTRNYLSPFKKAWRPAQIVALYQTSRGEWMMQIRWFYRFGDILKQHKLALSYLNQPHVVFETEVFEHLHIANALPGRVVLTSNSDVDNWDTKPNLHSGLPLIPLLCTHICLDEEIESLNDWTNYDVDLSKIPDPLSRGLKLSPRNRENKEWILMLNRHYCKSICNRKNDADSNAMIQWITGRNEARQSKQTTPFNPDDNKILLGDPISSIDCTGIEKEFYSLLEVHANHKDLVSARRNLSRTKNNFFEYRVGDVICYFDEKATIASRNAGAGYNKNKWRPFSVPWSYGQLLSIYKELNSDQKDSVKLEIRRFFRVTDLPEQAIEFFPTTTDCDREEIFETDNVIDEVDAYKLLGTVEVFLGQHAVSGESSSQKRRHVLSARCRFFFFIAFQRLQPIYSPSLLPVDWARSQQRRGFHLSKVLRHDESVRKEVIKQCTSFNRGDLSVLLSPTKKVSSEGACFRLQNQLSSKDTERVLYSKACIHPQWSLYSATDTLFRPAEAKEKTWAIRIGDFVAVKTKESLAESMYPFCVSWSPCQVLAIFHGSRHKFDVQLEIRLLKFSDKASQLVTELESPLIMTVDATDLLGPLVLHPYGVHSNTDLGQIQSHLPLAEFRATNGVFSNLGNALTLCSIYTRDDIGHICNTLNEKSIFASNTLTGAVLQGLGNTSSKRNPGETWTVVEPFYVQPSDSRSFYESMLLIPKCKIASGMEYVENEEAMNVKMGDIVIIRFSGSKRYPFDCNWGVAEIVAIFREFEQGAALHDFGGDMQIEIRWLYDRNDISTEYVSDESTKLTEVFETDHTQIMKAGTSILGNAILVEDPTEIPEEAYNRFICKRFWSTQRRSLIPCGGGDGRRKRGWMNSKCLPNNFNGLPMSQEASVVTSNVILSWAEVMAEVQTKLSLKDASENAYGSVEALVGREKEISELLSFFRAAIRGDPGVGGVKSSMVCAGPPGVGKTAVVRAAIARLQEDQQKGAIPKFRFISINGIEQRRPYDAYVTFWEALTGRRHIGSHEKACESLVSFFTAKPTLRSRLNMETIVVLLDEMDYLITEKQSVLYNFFDWPKRAADIEGGRRLVIVGISNTMNLVENLMPSVQSRVGTEKCLFKAYSLQDTVSILKAKIGDASHNYQFFEDDAIIFAAKKTAALSGDIRKAFQICRVAAEVVTQRFEQGQRDNVVMPTPYPKIKISDVQKASQESFNKAMVTAVSFCKSFEALLLVSVAALCRSTGREVGGFDVQDILSKMEAIASASGDPQYLPPPSFGETIDLMNRLAEINLLELKTSKAVLRSDGSGGAWPMTSLSVDELTLIKGLKNTLHKQLLEKNLPNIL